MDIYSYHEGDKGGEVDNQSLLKDAGTKSKINTTIPYLVGTAELKGEK